VDDPSNAQLVIKERQGEVDEDAEESTHVRDAFVEELRLRGHDPVRERILIPSSAAAPIVSRVTGVRCGTNRASTYLRTLAIAELRKSDRNGSRIWEWCGEKAYPNQQAIDLKDRPRDDFRSYQRGYNTP
jgi:hypothetical protein